MFEKAKLRRDAFTFSLGGMTTVASFVFAPAIADDKINNSLAKRPPQVRDDCEPRPSRWLRRNRQAALRMDCEPRPGRWLRSQRQAAQETCA